MKYIYSACSNAFFPKALQSSYESTGMWPDDGIDVSDVIFAEFTTPHPGKMRVVGRDGLPAWGDTPPPTAEELTEVATRKIAALRAEADTIIAPLKDALDGGYIDESDKLKLTDWQKYRYALTKVDPAKPVWPERPA
ncbi:tail fiber assembly protein [Citrobacter freundii]|nr:tail fiber assembly protein [Citrobacter freundii]